MDEICKQYYTANLLKSVAYELSGSAKLLKGRLISDLLRSRVLDDQNTEHNRVMTVQVKRSKQSLRQLCSTMIRYNPI